MWRKKKLRKRRSGKWTGIFWVLLLLLVVFLIFLFFKSGIFSIKQVEVQVGQLGCVDENQIRNAVNLAGQNIFFIDSAKVENNLKKLFFCIKSAPVSKIFPDKVKIQTTGRKPVAALMVLKDKDASASALTFSVATPSANQVGHSFLVDSEGIVFSRDTNEINIPKIYIYGSEIILGKKLEDDFNSALKILEKVKTIGMEINESFTGDNFFIINSVPPGPKVIFYLNEKIDIQLASLQLILDKAKIDLKELEFIDLRFDKPIVRFAPKK